MPYTPEQEKRAELEQNILKLLKPGIRLEDVADILDAKQFLRYQPGYGKRAPGVGFDVAGFVNQEMGKLKPIILPDKIETTNDVIIPPDSQELLIGDKGGELEERKLIPRTRYLIELLTDMKLDYSVISGIVDKRMMRQNPYVAFVVPSIKKVVFVNNEEGNRTFIIHNAEPKDEDHYAALTKEELKALEPSAKVSHIVWLGNPGDWKTMVSEGLLKTPELVTPEAKVEKSEKGEELQNRPEGWITNNGLAKKLNASFTTVRKKADKYKKMHPEWFKFYLDQNLRSQMYYHPDLVAIIEQELRKYESSPPGWLNNNELANELNVTPPTIKKRADDYLEDHPEWFKIYLDSVFKPSMYYHPDLVKIIRQELQSHIERKKTTEIVPPGWMTNHELGTMLNVHDRLVKQEADKYRTTHSEWFKIYLNAQSRPHIYYHPDLILIIKHDLQGYIEKQNSTEFAPLGWITNSQLAVMLDVQHATSKKMADKYREDHPEWFKSYLDKKNVVREYYHPDLVVIVERQLHDMIEKRKTVESPPSNWMNNSALAKDLGINANLVKRRADNYRENYPEWFKLYLGPNLMPQIYYHPDLVEMVRHDLKDYFERRETIDPVPLRWMNNYELVKMFKSKWKSVKSISDKYRKDHPEWYEFYSDLHNRIQEYFHPDLVEIIKKELKK